ncbi:MAG: hypothetical protein AAF999_00590 [Pseudomonadota bacterium]
MSHKFIATVVAAAVVIATIGNAPARADENMTRALAAIVGAAVVGAIINHELKDRKKEKKEKAAKRRKKKQVAPVRDYSWNDDAVIQRVEPRPLPARVERKLLPGNCLRSFETGEGRARVFGKKCLKKHYDYNRSLPQACAVKFRTDNKKRQGYNARCLRRQGYQLARW